MVGKHPIKLCGQEIEHKMHLDPPLVGKKRNWTFLSWELRKLEVISSFESFLMESQFLGGRQARSLFFLFRMWTVSRKGGGRVLACPHGGRRDGLPCSLADGTCLSSAASRPPSTKLPRDGNSGAGEGRVGNTVKRKQNINFKPRHCQLLPAELEDSIFGQESKKQKH